jgi:hypothetical protein
MKKSLLIISILFAGFAAMAQTGKEKGLESITIESLKGQLGFLASDWMEGRGVGTRGEYMAADYIASMFQVYGIKPFGDDEMPSYSGRNRRSISFPMGPRSKTYFQSFSLIKYEPGDDQSLSVISVAPGSESSTEFNYRTDFTVRTGTVGQSAKAPVVFVGYGYENSEKGYSDIAKLNLKGKAVLLLNGFPGHRDTTSVAYKKFAPAPMIGRNAPRQNSSDRNRLEAFEKAGVVAIILVNPDSDPVSGWSTNQIYPAKGNYYEADKPLATYYDTQMAMPTDTLSVSLPIITVTNRLANELIKGTGLNFTEFEKTVAKTMLPASRELTGKAVAFHTSVKSEVLKVRNVIGYIEGEKKDEYIVVGGHYDHLGKWDGYIWNGADDNGSGTVGVMEIAKAFMATGKKPQKSIVFAAWTGEEKGLYGSEYFVAQAKKKNMNVVLNLNYDMISRDVDRDSLKNMADMNYTKAYPAIEALTKKNIADYKINLDMSYRASERPSGGSDHAPFAAVDIPVLYFEAAMHPDYHQPSDEISKINWEKMANIIRIGFLNMWDIANSDEYLKKE